MPSLPLYFPPSYQLPRALLCAELLMAAYDQYEQWLAQQITHGQPKARPTPNGDYIRASHHKWSLGRCLHDRRGRPAGGRCARRSVRRFDRSREPGG